MRALTRDQVRQVDRLAIEELGIPGVVLMENAGRAVAQVVLELIRDSRASPGAGVVVLCGGGNNGGDGYVVARHLHNAGVEVAICPVAAPESLKGDARVNATIALKMGMRFAFIRDAQELADQSAGIRRAGVVVDALLGTGFTGEVRPHMAAVIRLCNEAPCGRVVAVDLPSGLDCDTGRPAEPTIRADVTVTFVAPKVGFGASQAATYLGRVIVADIGTPPELVDRVV